MDRFKRIAILLIVVVNFNIINLCSTQFLTKISCEMCENFLPKYSTKISWQQCCWRCRIFSCTGYIKRTLKGGSYSYFPAQILTKSHLPTAQIPSSLCLSCSNLNLIPIFYCFFVDESQSQCMKSHFPSQKMGKSQFPFYPFRTLYKGFPLKFSLQIIQSYFN